VRRLREITSPPTILKGAPRALSGIGAGAGAAQRGAGRRDGRPRRAFRKTDPERAEKVVATLAEHPIRLEHPLLEAEVLRRRRATGVSDAQAYESAALRRGLRHEREQMRRFLDRLDTRLGELSDAGVEIAPWDSVAEAEPPPPPPTEVGSAFDRILTRRELEVVALMAEGLSNRTIADRLVITEGTVKFHVNSILKKLRAANRAEAVSRYLSRGGGGRS
jgi:DNA-binding CsgD family transcriptional regulator